MFGFIIALVVVTFAILKLGSEFIKGRQFEMNYNLAIKKRDKFFDKYEATPDVIRQFEQNKDYSDVVKDINYIFRMDYSASWIGDLIQFSRREFGGEITYKDIVLEIRLAKIGKCYKLIQTTGVRFCDGVNFYPSLVRFYELLQKYYAENGVQVHRIEKVRNGFPIKEMTFKEMTIIW